MENVLKWNKSKVANNRFWSINPLKTTVLQKWLNCQESPRYNPEPELAQLLYCCRRQYAQRKSREANNRASRHQNIPVVQALRRCEIVWPTGRRWMQGRPLPHINQRTVPYKEWTRIPCIVVIFQSATPYLVPDVPIATTQLEAGRKYQELLKIPQPKTKATYEMVHGFRLTTSNGLFRTLRMGNYKHSIYQQGKGKKSQAERDFEQIRSLAETSQKSTVRDFMEWAQAQDAQTRGLVNNKFFRRKNFDQQLMKCFKLNSFWKRTFAWGERLKQFSQKKGYMTIDESTSLLVRWMAWNGFQTRTKFSKKSLIQEVLEVVDQKTNKINCIIFTGESNAGKSMVMRSIIKAFNQDEVEEIYQGNNNFMFQDCI